MKVYFIKPVGMAGPIKIGVSCCAEARLFEMAGHSPVPLEIIAVTPQVANLERRLHAAFADRRLHREWFAESAPLLSLIEEIRLGTFDPVNVPEATCKAPRRPNGTGTQTLRQSTSQVSSSSISGKAAA